jgi:hypothetical protein
VNAPVLFCSIASSCPPQHQPQSPSSLFSSLPSSNSPSLSPVARFTTEEFARIASVALSERVITLLTSRNTTSSLHYRPHDSSAPRAAPSRSSQPLHLISSDTTPQPKYIQHEANTATRGRRSPVVCDHCHFGCFRQHTRPERG